MTLAGSKVSKAPGKDSFAVSFKQLGVRKVMRRKVPWRWEKARGGLEVPWVVDRRALLRVLRLPSKV